MIPFKKYNSLKLIRTNRMEELYSFKAHVGDERCCVMEKIHGSNFAMSYDGEAFADSRRTDYLVEGEDFYGYSYITEIYHPVLKAMYDEVKELLKIHQEAYDAALAAGEQANPPEINPNFDTLTIRGELAGGHFPDVEKLKVGHGQVGKGGIWYSQSKEFYAFSIEIDGKPLDIYNVIAFCRGNNIPMAPILFWGTFSECLEYSKENLDKPSEVSTMQMRLGADGKPLMENGNYVHLPILPDNIREGHVITPVRYMGDQWGGALIFKHKGAQFAENAGAKKEKVKVEIEFTPAQQYVFDAVLPSICDERLKAVESKEGEFKPKDFNRAVGLVVQDAIEAAWNDGFSVFAHHWGTLTTKERKQVTGQLNREGCVRFRDGFFK